MAELIAGKQVADLVVSTDTDFRIHTRAYSDPGVFELEMENIFESSWIYVAHESEIENPGDYKTTFMGRQPVIVSRARDGSIHVLLNVCRHRGNTVCRELSGNVKILRCGYHGWSYGLDGKLIRVTGNPRYDKEFREKVGGLKKAAGVATLRGLIFASLNDPPITFEDYIDPIRPYINAWADASLGAEFKVMPAIKISYGGNWKFQAENGYDGYHARATHESAVKALYYDPANPDQPLPEYDDTNPDLAGPAFSGAGATRGFKHGHGCVDRGDRTAFNRAYRYRYIEEEGYYDELVEALGKERTEAALVGRHLLIWPNIFLMDKIVRVIQPVAHDKTIVHQHFVSPRGASEYMVRENYEETLWRLGPGGMFSSDDLDIFEGNHLGATADKLEWFQLSRGLHEEFENEDGERIGGASDEVPNRAFYRQWRRLMANEGIEYE